MRQRERRQLQGSERNLVGHAGVDHRIGAIAVDGVDHVYTCRARLDLDDVGCDCVSVVVWSHPGDHDVVAFGHGCGRSNHLVQLGRCLDCCGRRENASSEDVRGSVLELVQLRPHHVGDNERGGERVGHLSKQCCPYRYSRSSIPVEGDEGHWRVSICWMRIISCEVDFDLRITSLCIISNWNHRLCELSLHDCADCVGGRWSIGVNDIRGSDLNVDEIVQRQREERGSEGADWNVTVHVGPDCGVGAVSSRIRGEELEIRCTNENGVRQDGHAAFEHQFHR